MTLPTHTLTARWLFPADRPPLEHGTITIQGDTIVAVEPCGRRQPDEDLGNVAILPGLVNAHTHLDLSGMRGLCPPSADFSAWLRSVIQHRRQRTPEETVADIRAGLAECQRYGTTLIGDISSGGLSQSIVKTAPLWSVVFLELLGLSKDRADQAYRQAVDWLASETSQPAAGLPSDIGLSPHAPYSVRRDLFRKIAELIHRAFEHGRVIPVAVHLAESPQETELLEHRRGPMVEFLKELGVWDPAGLVSSASEVIHLFDRTPRNVFVHANNLDPGESGWGSIVYCPRTHAAFGHAPHPFREFLARGACVALGTDSLASNPDLDVLAEARFVHRLYPDVPGDVLLRMATLNGAIALGWHDVTGSLTPGKSADLVVLPIAVNQQRIDDPHGLIFANDARVERVMWRGSWLNVGKLP